MNLPTQNSVLIVAAEASSAMYAKPLVERFLKNQIQVFGVGTQELESLGMHRIGAAEEMAVVGVAEVLAHYSDIKSVFTKIIGECDARRPKIAILMDYPGFNLRLIPKLRALGIKVYYYIAPQIWAWKQGRSEILRKNDVEVLCIFPFEEDFYRRRGVKCRFVGHPLLDIMPKVSMDADLRQLNRSRYGVGSQDVVLGLLPGSRKAEIELNFSTQLETAYLLTQQFPHLKILVGLAPTVKSEWIEDKLAQMGSVSVRCLRIDPVQFIELTDVVLATSGTVTLQVALLGKPMVMMYKMKLLTYYLARLLVRGVQFFGMPNILARQQLVPEFWQAKASAKLMAQALSVYIGNEEEAKAQSERELTLRQSLGNGGATDRVLEILLGEYV